MIYVLALVCLVIAFELWGIANAAWAAATAMREMQTSMMALTELHTSEQAQRCARLQKSLNELRAAVDRAGHSLIIHDNNKSIYEVSGAAWNALLAARLEVDETP